MGQEIRATTNFKRGRTAEVDYMVDANQGVIPIEVKAGVAGKLKNLHLLLNSQPEIPNGIKVSLDNFQTHGRIQSIPIYAFGAWLENNRDLSR